jgi:Fe-Mn family superoxide dismutase
MAENTYPFTLVPLPYDYDALEPYISTETMKVHHDRLLKAYVDKLNAVLAAYPRFQEFTLTQLLENTEMLPDCVRTSIINFGGGVFNHNFFFQSMRPVVFQNCPSGSLKQMINAEFGSYEMFQKVFKEEAMAVFGSGWLWLVRKDDGSLLLKRTANQDSAISLGYKPITVIDVWEHAYFLQYLNLRGEYIDHWFHVVDWAKAEERYASP